MRYQAYHDKPIIHLETLEIIAESDSFKALQDILKDKYRTYPSLIIIKDTKHNVQIMLTDENSLNELCDRSKKDILEFIEWKKNKKESVI